jgi:hypothetical protein
MPESSIFEEFDIAALRGWKDPSSDVGLIVPSTTTAARTDVITFKDPPRNDSIQAVLRGMRGSSSTDFSMMLPSQFADMGIPEEKRTMRTAGSYLVVFSLGEKMEMIVKRELPILMPDILQVEVNIY